MPNRIKIYERELKKIKKQYCVFCDKNFDFEEIHLMNKNNSNI